MLDTFTTITIRPSDHITCHFQHQSGRLVELCHLSSNCEINISKDLILLVALQIG